MGNVWTGVDREKLMHAERKMFLNNGIADADIEQQDIYLDGDKSG